MKLSRKEMSILAIFLFIVIIAIGAFLFVLPEYDKIEPNKNSLQAARDEKDRIYASLEREATIDKEIQYAIDQANTLSLYFYDDMTEYEADAVVREILAATNMRTDSLSLGSFTTSTLTVSDYVETVVSYPLKSYSGYTENTVSSSGYSLQYDEEGRIVVPDEYVEKYGEEQALAEYLVALFSTQSQTIGAITVSFTVTGTRDDFLGFLNYVANLERATHINSTSVSFDIVVAEDNNNTPAESEEADEGEAAAEAEGAAENDEEPAPPADAPEGGQQLGEDAQISAGISMTLYCVKPMQGLETTETEPEPETSDSESSEPEPESSEPEPAE